MFFSLKETLWRKGVLLSSESFYLLLLNLLEQLYVLFILMVTIILSARIILQNALKIMKELLRVVSLVCDIRVEWGGGRCQTLFC